MGSSHIASPPVAERLLYLIFVRLDNLLFWKLHLLLNNQPADLHKNFAHLDDRNRLTLKSLVSTKLEYDPQVPSSPVCAFEDKIRLCRRCATKEVYQSVLSVHRPIHVCTVYRLQTLTSQVHPTNSTMVNKCMHQPAMMNLIETGHRRWNYRVWTMVAQSQSSQMFQHTQDYF